MRDKFVCIFFGALFLTIITSYANIIPPSELICGKWESSEKNLIIQIYHKDNNYFAKIIWFKDTDGKPMDYWKDVRNPNPKLRSRKILGMGILSNLVYEPKTNSWENGRVYDSRHGRTWNASGYIDKSGKLRVRGYWHFKFIGRTLTFYRLKG